MSPCARAGSASPAGRSGSAAPASRRSPCPHAARGGAGTATRPCPRAGGGHRALPWPRRGSHALPAPRLERRDPLGLARRVVVTGGEEPVLVLPRLEPVRALTGGLGAALGTEATGAVAGAESELDGLRP